MTKFTLKKQKRQTCCSFFFQIATQNAYLVCTYCSAIYELTDTYKTWCLILVDFATQVTNIVTSGKSGPALAGNVSVM